MRKLWKKFSRMKNMASRKIFWHFRCANFFIFRLLISNHTVFLVQSGINLYLWVFQKAEIALAEAAHAISAFWKTHSCKLIPNWMRKTYDYLYLFACANEATKREQCKFRNNKTSGKYHALVTSSFSKIIRFLLFFVQQKISKRLIYM